MSYRLITIDGHNPKHGIYDPSICYERDGKKGYMVYSALSNTAPDPHPAIDSTHMAKTMDNGKTWKYMGCVNPPTVLPDGTMYKYETPTICYNPDEPFTPWRVFSQKIFWSGANVPGYSLIACREASSPGALASSGTLSVEKYMFRSRFTTFDGSFQALDVGDLPGAGDDLRSTVVFSEPSALVYGDVLYVCLTAVEISGPAKIVLISSRDFGQTWDYNGVIIGNGDAEAEGYNYYDGASMVAVGDRIFFLASPGSNVVAHNGTFVFEFEGIESGQLRLRQAADIPLVIKVIPPQENLSSAGAGQSTYDPHNTGGGVIFPQIDLREFPKHLRIFSTDIQLP